ncbi:hypothetical protein BGZ82_008046 [Podila clonocystis]|nr:hypothetical protein BGZ82_008046 [Podila clonocystis]
METTESKESTESTVPSLNQVFREQQLSNPDSLCVGSEIDFEDAELSSCLEVMDEVTMLTVDQGDFGPMSLHSLVPHFNGLQSLLLGRCYSVTGSMVQSILESSLKSVYIMNIKMDHDTVTTFWEGCLEIQDMAISVIYPQDTVAFFDLCAQLTQPMNTRCAMDKNGTSDGS